jgi:hypothetical protein
MDGQNTIVTHYAILIGIDGYPDKPLKSCVRDVQDIKIYLESILCDSVEVQMITASQIGPNSSDAVKDRVLWPTYDNTISAFKRVTSLARAGDFVYIHYSGHGTRKPPSGEFTNSIGDLALVFLTKENRETCLWGFELASLLDAMVNKGLVTTLVLDCCFSGSVYRRDDLSIRFLPYHAEMVSEHQLDLERSFKDEILPYRNVSMRPNWLINPDGYTILTACGPHEETVGSRFDGQGHGALSYFLLESIKCVGLTKRHMDIYNHLRAKFRGSGLPHNPILYGNGNQCFFGQASSGITAAAVPIIVKRGGILELQAGHAHGVTTDDQFVLYHLGCAEGDSGFQGCLVNAKVVSTKALISDLEQLNTPPIRIRIGWMARVYTRLSL